MNITTIIFDMDGVLSDTQHLHALAESALLKQYGIKLSPEEILDRMDTFMQSYVSKAYSKPNLTGRCIETNSARNEYIQF